ncbi:hypothetical protein CDG81_20105 [Actinopolyspora erythraea]|uniref:Mce-associated membrane protein n=1 Tax=Actinopolyspora erythraea TaxID=414996 RepID=A0A223RWE0_9ACTN|nr:hypothetical protein CDG81_20105 [Actinopolyspora erythraea]
MAGTRNRATTDEETLSGEEPVAERGAASGTATAPERESAEPDAAAEPRAPADGGGETSTGSDEPGSSADEIDVPGGQNFEPEHESSGRAGETAERDHAGLRAGVEDTTAAAATSGRDGAEQDGAEPERPAREAGSERGTRADGTDSAAGTEPVETEARSGAERDEGDPAEDSATDPSPETGGSEAGSTEAASTEEGSTEAAGSEESSAEESSAAARSGSERRRGKVLTAVLLVLTVGFTGLACWFQYSAHTLRHGGPAANRALVDEAATSEVKGQVSKKVEKIFSFDYSDMDKTDEAADGILVGEAVGQYDKMFKTVREQAPQQKMVLTTTTAESGVTMLRDGRAEVLLFVNQNATRTGDGEGGVYPAQLSVVAVKRGEEWKISSMTQL